MSKVLAHTFKVRTSSGETESATIFTDEQGFVKTVVNVESLVSVATVSAKKLSVNPNTQLIVTDEVKRNMKFFSEHSPCWFEGCEKLRELYKKEVTELESNGNCQGCQKGAVIRKYLQLVATTIRSLENETTT
jgi:hypothetical protein